ncbi:PadR family transcriptional regulator [Alicyclobacillus acidoterrestris]|uniref:PadR family transcriptional regulator n=1 Tax=Alicyclobacillus acidoterrestris (strain ATCC 49025 / DSM 3922 / CIP 106132 / NCIMB 13137 / GD3B) TaxID=1356854 RepID=T0BJM9_ALIAG|nr:PadR family transcriptional regulator [Alicyclobacillus acidoterrestris]EPZ44178.1 hypothetical protein N007_11685 [Alicyclobacillus acidoterrestris ATCC 49025]UNO49691.1 PadR family transcriptional regulator [Alicyclobacillus acidoterrestris]
MDKELLKGSTPLVVLSLLQNKPMYGYELMKEIEVVSGGELAFKEGTLYPILHHFEMLGYVTASWSSGAGSRKRKYYAITDEGRAHLVTKKREWRAFRSAVEKFVGEEFA